MVAYSESFSPSYFQSLEVPLEFSPHHLSLSMHSVLVVVQCSLDQLLSAVRNASSGQAPVKYSQTENMLRWLTKLCKSLWVTAREVAQAEIYRLCFPWTNTKNISAVYPLLEYQNLCCSIHVWSLQIHKWHTAVMMYTGLFKFMISPLHH